MIRKKLVVADLSNIEGRVLSWIAGEEWKLQAFRDYDTVIGVEDGKKIRKGPDLYNVTAVSILGGDPWKVSKKNRNVFGKVPDLACLAADTQVLTNHGLKSIVAVSTDDLLWDGIEWVKHEGLADHGVRQVVDVDGIRATPDHLINTKGTWLQAQALASSVSTLSLALVTGSEALLSYLRRPQETSVCSATVAQNHTESYSVISFEGPAPVAPRAQSKPLEQQGNCTGATKLSVPTKSTADDCSIASPLVSTDVATQTTLLTPTMVGEGSRCTLRGSKIGASSSPTWSDCRGGTTPCLNSTERMSTRDTNLVTSDLSPAGPTETTSGQFKNYRPPSSNSEPVFDLLNAGPRNRFLVKSKSGWLLVHNSGYQGGVAGYQTFARAYGVRMEEHWETIQDAGGDELVDKAHVNFEKFGYEQLATLEISETEWLASEVCKLIWRQRHPATTKFWYDLQNAMAACIRSPGLVKRVGQFITVKCTKHKGQSWLLIKLPSGRYLTYFNPSMRDGSVTYEGMATEEGGRKFWTRIYTHGGKATGNCCQTIARDILAPALLIAEDTGYIPVLSVHDEALTETPDTPEYTADGLVSILSRNPEWAVGLPLAAEGFETYRYYKE